MSISALGDLFPGMDWENHINNIIIQVIVFSVPSCKCDFVLLYSVTFKLYISNDIQFFFHLLHLGKLSHRERSYKHQSPELSEESFRFNPNCGQQSTRKPYDVEVSYFCQGVMVSVAKAYQLMSVNSSILYNQMTELCCSNNQYIIYRQNN